MATSEAIVITGVGEYWGSRLAGKLLQESGSRVIGIDSRPPADDIEGLDFIEAELDNPLVGELIEQENVAVLCHLKFSEQDKFDNRKNTQVTISLLKACSGAGVSNIILRSSTSVYGAHPENPAFLKENAPLRGSDSPAYNRAFLEIEKFCADNQNYLEGLTIFRFANIVGRVVDSPMTRFLRQERPIVLFGYDPVTQFVHEDDVVEALAQGAKNPVPGVYNLGADGAMPLTRVMRLVGMRPTPLFYKFAKKKFSKKRKMIFGQGKMRPIDWDYLRFPWVADLTKMRDKLGFYPKYTAGEALREFAGTAQEE